MRPHHSIRAPGYAPARQQATRRRGELGDGDGQRQNRLSNIPFRLRLQSGSQSDPDRTRTASQIESQAHCYYWRRYVRTCRRMASQTCRTFRYESLKPNIRWERRVKTLRERFTSGFYAEAGAMRIPDHHGLTMWLIQSLFNLPTLNFFNHSPNGLIYINNQRMTYSQYEENPGLCKFSLKDHEKNRTAYQLFDLCVQNHVRKHFSDLSTFEIKMLLNNGGLSKEQLYRIMEHFDHYSLRQFLVDEARIEEECLSQGAIDMICAVMAHEMQMSSSMAFVVSQYIEFNAPSHTYRSREEWIVCRRHF